jgi:hypothetical protein
VAQEGRTEGQVAADEPKPETLLAIYQEICGSHNAIADFRAKLLAALPLASGVGIFLLTDKSAADGLQVKALLPIGLFGVVAVIGLFMYEVRGIQDCTFLRKRAGAIEQQLKLQIATTQFNSRPAARCWGFADEIGAGWIVYGAVIAAWLFVAGYGVFGDGGLCGARRPGGLVAVGAAATLVFILMVAGSRWSRTDEREDGQGGPRGRSPDNV